MTPITKLVERLRGSVPEKYPGFRNLNIEAASMLETLWAEVEAGRKMNDHKYTDDPDSPNCLLGGTLVDAYEQARRATDAELGRGGE